MHGSVEYHLHDGVDDGGTAWRTGDEEEFTTFF
jgi:hypothetical protein